MSGTPPIERRGAPTHVSSLAQSPQTGKAAVVVEDLVVRFDEVEALAGVSFAVAAGEVFALLGPNGAGKTTIIRVLTTLLAPTAGRATVGGFDVRSQSLQVRASIGYVPRRSRSTGR